MQLGLNLGYWGAGNDADNLVLAQEDAHEAALTADRAAVATRRGAAE